MVIIKLHITALSLLKSRKGYQVAQSLETAQADTHIT